LTTRLHHSHFQPDPARIGEWLACLWQGPAPADLVIRQWLYLEGEPRGMIMLWDGGEAAEAYVARAFGGFGALTTQVVSDATPGMVHAIARDLDAFGDWMRGRGAPAEEVARQVDLRRRGKTAASQDAALAQGRAWAAGD
jgi:hypothetical protein